ncbi:MAG TPA: hypothetical protein VLZ89_10290 [Anaerolineales bacterium]|nr:hypothetical protein [Anaerolineales bacterium]
MKFTTFIVPALVALTLLVSACAPAATPAPQPAPTQPPATQAPAATSSSSSSSASATTAPSGASGPATVNLGNSSKYSAFLVDAKGMSLYLYTKDTPGTSVCSGKCATSWPPLLTTGTPVAGSGVDASKFGTTTRTDGTTQVTYNGWPLYYYAKDQQPGDTSGQGVGSVWYLVSPTGDQVASGG